MGATRSCIEKNSHPTIAPSSPLPDGQSLAVWGALQEHVRVGSVRGIALRGRVSIPKGQERHVEELCWGHVLSGEFVTEHPVPVP